MKKSVFVTLAFAACLCAEAGYKKGELLWSCDFSTADVAKYAPLRAKLAKDGTGWTVRPQGGKDGDGALFCCVKAKGGSAKFDIVPDRKITGLVFIEADVKGVDLLPGPHDYNGPKIMFPHKEKPGARTQFPQLPSEYGSFDWKTWIRVHRLAETTADLTCVLGLECARGEFWIDRVAVYRAVEIPDEDVVAPFNAKAAAIPRGRFAAKPNPEARRGVMSGHDMSDSGVADLASWGVNLIRLQINISRQDTMEDYFAALGKKLDWCVEVLDRCAKYDIRAVIDLHTGPGCKTSKHASNMLPDDYDAADLCRAWRMIAKRLKDHPMTYAYDILNEPSVSPATWDRVFREAMKAVREIDRTTPFVTQSFHTYYPGEKVFYSPHYYSPHTLTHFGVGGIGKVRWSYPGYIDGVYWDKEQIRCCLEREIRFQTEHPDAKIFVGEFSCILWTKGADKYIRDCIEIFEEYGWSWTYHAYREWPPWSVEHTDDGKLTVGRTLPAKTDTPRKIELLKGLMRNRATVR